jgi:hypothetical protein
VDLIFFPVAVPVQVEYQSYPSLQWHPCLFEQSVVLQLQQTQYTNYLEKVKSTTCQAELRRLLQSGPPIYVSDPMGFPMAVNTDGNGDTYVGRLWFASDNKERSAKLQDALEGEARQELWNELKRFLVVKAETNESDDDD